MLTGDLVRARRRGDAISPQYLRGEAVLRVLPIADALASVFASHVGASREELEQALAAVSVPARDRVAALGLRKLLEDRSEFESATAIEPEALRMEVFLEAARAHKSLDVVSAFDRGAVLDAIADRRQAKREDIERALFADLRGREILRRFDPISGPRLVDRYNLALAQAMLFRAVKIRVRVTNDDPARLRRLFRAARFHGLLYLAKASAAGETTLDIDGPFSLFDAVQKYGVKLALFLPSLVALDRFELVADLRWGKERAPATFTLTHEDGLVADMPEAPSLTPELELFAAAFTRLESDWEVAPAKTVFALPGEIACVPDLMFIHKSTGEAVYLEAFGFWSRQAVWQRVELLRKKETPFRLILAVGKHLRVSEEVLDEDACGEVVVYKQTLSPRAILDRLERRA